jgi:Mrp family chromosome partitioning ATPase
MDPDLIAAALRTLSPDFEHTRTRHARHMRAPSADAFNPGPNASDVPPSADAPVEDGEQAPEPPLQSPDPPITNDVSRLFSLLNLHVGGDARGTVIEFISSHRGEGTSTVAREFAQICAMHSDKPVLLLDLDLRRDKQFTHFAERHGRDKELRRPGGAVQFGVDLGHLVRLDKEVIGLGPAEHVITAHRVGDSSLYVSRVHPHVRQRKAVPHMTKVPALWDQLRRVTAVTVVDSPPFTDSFDGLSVSGLVDLVIIVIEAESTRTPVVAELCDRLTSQNATIAGAIFNKRRFYIPRFIYRWI